MSVEALLAELHGERRAIAERVVERIRAEMPSFDAVPRAEQTDGVEVMIALLVGARMQDANPAVGDGTRLLREIGERRARQGVPVDDLLRAWRIGLDEITARGRELAERSDVSPAQLFDLLRQASGLADNPRLELQLSELWMVDAEVFKNRAAILQVEMFENMACADQVIFVVTGKSQRGGVGHNVRLEFLLHVHIDIRRQSVD